MKIFFRTAVLLLAGTLSLQAAGIPKKGGVCFRFDDNKPVSQWKELAAVFEKYGMRFSMSIIPSAKGAWTQDGWLPFLQEMEAKGYEIMDHTPYHQMFRFKPADGEEKALLDRVKTVDHIDKDGWSCFKFTRDPAYPEVVPVVCDLSGKTAVPVAKPNRCYVYGYLYDPETKTAWYSAWNARAGVFSLRSFWYEDNVNLPERKGVKLELIRNFGGFDLAEDALKLQLEVSRKRFRGMGLKKMPVIYVLPGAYEPHLSGANLMKVYREAGYLGGTANQRPSLWGYCTHFDPDRSRFAMSAWTFTLENPKGVRAAKHIIADYVAKNRVATSISHMRVNALPGKWKEFLKHQEELLKWCRDNQIPVHVEKDWTTLLYDTGTDPAWNIMPQIGVDLDKDGIPDGYRLFPAAKVSGKNLMVSGKGTLFGISELCGAEPGKNIFSFRYRAKQESSLRILILVQNLDGKSLKKNLLNVKLTPGPEQQFQGEFLVPDNADMLNIQVQSMEDGAEAELRDFCIQRKGIGLNHD